MSLQHPRRDGSTLVVLPSDLSIVCALLFTLNLYHRFSLGTNVILHGC